VVVSSHATASLVEVALTRLASAHIDDHAPVLPAHARARWSTPSIAAPRFGDLAWDLTGLRATPLERSVIDFADLPPQWALYAREVCWWRVNGTDQARDVLPAKIWVRNWEDVRPGRFLQFQYAFRVIVKACDELGLGLPAAWTETDTDRLRDWTRENWPRATMATVVRSLHLFAPVLTLGGVQHDPVVGNMHKWAGASLRGQGLRGQALAPEVFAPLVRSAIAYVETYSLDILAAMQYRQECEDRFTGTWRHPVPLKVLIEQFVAEHGALPASTIDGGTSQRGSWSPVTLLAMLGYHRRSVQAWTYDTFNQMRADGIPLRPGMLPIPITEVTYADGSSGPWREPFCYRSIEREVQTLRKACIVLIIAFTGMRVSEVQRLPRTGWRTTWFGHPAVTSSLVKTRDGEDAKWWATDLVLRACEVLEQTLPDVKSRYLIPSRYEVPLLFTADPDTGENAETSIASVDFALAHFAVHINWSPTLLHRDVIPGVERKEQKKVNTRSLAKGINPHSLRFTLASIGNLAVLGDLALQQQCKHAQASMTWSYMNNGATDKWVALLIDAKATRGLETALDFMAGVWTGNDELGGPRGRTLSAEIRQVLDHHNVPEFDPDSEAGEAQQFLGIVASSRELVAYARSLAKNLHLGAVNHCYHDRLKAMCGDSVLPILSKCVPERCGNVVLDSLQTEMYIALAEEIDEILADVKVRGGQRELLQERRRELGRQIGLPIVEVR
jgi:integrase